MKNLFLVIVTICVSLVCKAQEEFSYILLKGYRCVYFEDETPDVMAAMKKGDDTFFFFYYSRDISGEIQDVRDMTPANLLKAGLEDCFGDLKYFKTKDSLYISTGRKKGVCQYVIYVPEQMVSFSIHSNKRDSSFSEKSKWLLSQIRKKRKHKDIRFINDQHQTCGDPYFKD